MGPLEPDRLEVLRNTLSQPWVFADDLDADFLARLETAAQELTAHPDALPRDHFFAAQASELIRDGTGMIARLHDSRTVVGANRDHYDWQATVSISAQGQGQMQAMRESGMAPPLIVSQPKSASDGVAFGFARATGVTTCRVSKGTFHNARIVPNWLQGFQAGGFTTHDHAPASPDNLALLAASGLDRLVLQIREPMDAALSLYRMMERMEHGRLAVLFHNLTGAPEFARFTRMAPSERMPEVLPVLLDWMIAWLRDWRDVVANPPRGMTVDVVRFEDILPDPPAIVRHIASWFGRPIPDGCTADAVSRAALSGHWNSGITARRAVVGAWRDELPETLQKHLMPRLDPSLYDDFRWPLPA